MVGQNVGGIVELDEGRIDRAYIQYHGGSGSGPGMKGRDCQVLLRSRPSPLGFRFSAGCESFGPSERVRRSRILPDHQDGGELGRPRRSGAVRLGADWLGRTSAESSSSATALSAWVTGASPGPEVGHTAAVVVIAVWILLVDRALPLKSTSATVHAAGPTRLGSRAT